MRNENEGEQMKLTKGASNADIARGIGAPTLHTSTPLIMANPATTMFTP